MKNLKRFTGILIAAALLFIYACELDEECKHCKTVTYEKDNGNWVVVEESAAEEYCGDALEDIEAEDPVIVGDTKTQWECE